MSNKVSMSAAQEFVFYRTYARWREDLGRRETWQESVDRYFKFMKDHFGDKVPAKVFERCHENVLSMGVMPSMRALQMSGKALERNHIVGYNCCSLVMNDPQSFVELLYILLCGVGVGFSVEKEYISKLPTVKAFEGAFAGTHVVGDDRESWANSLKIGLDAWFNGRTIEFDYSKVRPRGSILKTTGGRSSGPEPLAKLHSFVQDVFLKAQGRQLTSLEILDICNMIAEIVVVGGVRRSSEISFSDLNDDALRHAKDFPFPNHRRMSNNTAVYHGRPDMITFMKEWSSLAASGSGERGIFNLDAANKSSPRREPSAHFRTNPCGEICLRADMGEFCNLTSVVIRSTDTFQDAQEKIKSATWLGAMQASLTDFNFIRPSFKKICDEERLLGVSLSGQMDNPRLMSADRLYDLKELAIKTARKAAKSLDINMPVAITTVKPEGTTSQLTNSSSGCHPRYAKFYIRRYRISGTDPLYKAMKEQGIKFTPEVGERAEDLANKRKELKKSGRSAEEIKILVPEFDPEKVMTSVVSFPEKAPEIRCHQARDGRYTATRALP